MHTVVLDDDPTGTQAASGVPVLLRWTTEELAGTLAASGSVYLQTNSRAIPADAARALAERLRGEIAEVERLTGEPALVVLRGDSTLRGHVFTESDVFAGAEGRILFVPAFPGGGRTTVDGVHRVVVDGVATPVGETEFARDPVFGYRSSYLADWVRERGDRGSVAVSLAELRGTDGSAVADALAEARPGEVVLPDAEADADLVLVDRGLRLALERGIPVVVRSAATLAAIVAGRLSPGSLPRPIAHAPGAVVVICGSHTDAAGAQLRALLDATGATPVVIPTDDAFADPVAAGRAAGRRLAEALAASPVAVLASERHRRAEDGTLAHGELVMTALMTAAREAVPPASTVVSKGGITSAEVARTLFAADRATVRGQLAAGISVWDYDDGGTQVVVPGNVGDAGTLVDVLDALGIGIEREVAR